eukprot:10297940-Alexandrium_andersonii.AAC.1
MHLRQGRLWIEAALRIAALTGLQRGCLAMQRFQSATAGRQVPRISTIERQYPRSATVEGCG